MKTISVKEAAEALGVTPRAVQYKLQNGDLKGTRSKNQYGVAEWRVWPNKEISEALGKLQGTSPGAGEEQELNFAPSLDAVDAEIYSDQDELLDEPSSWRDIEMERLEIMAEKLVKPLAERVETQALALQEQGKVIEEQNRQLRLLPDLQKQAEEERNAAVMKALEVEALKKQILAMEEKEKYAELKLAELESERRLAEEAQSKVRQMEQEMAEIQKARDAQAQVVQEQLAELNKTLEHVQQPWWKKWFMPRDAGE